VAFFLTRPLNYKISAIISAMFKRKLLIIKRLARLAQKAQFCHSLYTYKYIYAYIFIFTIMCGHLYFIALLR